MGWRRWESTAARDQASRVLLASPSRTARWIVGHTPASVQVWNQRWAVARVTPNRPSAFSQEQPEA
jgi:hypothetical protein